MIAGKGSTTEPITEAEVRTILAQAFDPLPVDGKRVLVIIPDGTRTSPIPMMFRLLYEQIGKRVARLDYIIALGTHMPMSEEAIARRIGVTKQERAALYPNVEVYNHQWDNPAALRTAGVITRAELDELTGGLLAQDTPVTINKRIDDYDHLVILGPVFPHEVVGFSGGVKYLFPGISGPEIIHFTHWVAALVTCMDTIGIKDTPVRRILRRAAKFIDKPITVVAMALKGHSLQGVFAGPHEEAWSAAADLSAQLDIAWMDHPFQRVLAVMPSLYDDIWTAGKGMYKTEPVIADGGEVIIYAPNIDEISYTHGALIRQVGYHVKDYITKQWDRFKDVPWSILAHSTHVRGIGTYVNGIECPRVQVTLATRIPEDVCRSINLGYCDPDTIHPEEWANREDEGVLLVRNAGEYLYRLKNDPRRPTH